MAEESLASTEKLIIIGGSSGSIEALLILLPALNKDFATPIILVLHRYIQSDSTLAGLLGRRTTMIVKEADEKEQLQPHHIYIAPADYHLLVESDRTLSLDASAKINFSRPSIDVSFISAANACGKNLVAVLLSGANADGAAGMSYVMKKGGQVLVQDPATALVNYMPQQAIAQTHTTNIFTMEGIAAWLNMLGSG